MGKQFNFEQFVSQVFAVEPGETVLLMVDEPTVGHPMNRDWKARHEMAELWSQRFQALADNVGYTVLPIVHVPAVDHDNGEFPETALIDGRPVELQSLLDQATLVIALTEVSATAALMQISRKRPGARAFRAASAPLARIDMEETCYNIDYDELATVCEQIRERLVGAVGAEVTFSSGHHCYFDLRHRQPGVDNGYLRRDKEGVPLINLPSGEVWITPYEGELPDDVSKTTGEIPIAGPDGGVAILHVAENRIRTVSGSEPAKSYFEAMLEVDPARRNIGELAFGCNRAARLSGLYIEEEKAGLHIGIGRSEFLGGTVGPDSFSDVKNVLHLDQPYAAGCSVSAEQAVLIDAQGERVTVIENGSYTLW